MSHLLDAAGAVLPIPRSRFVERVDVLEPAAGRGRYERLPDGRTTIVFRVFEEGRRGDVYAVGPRTRAMSKSISGTARAIILQLRPGWSMPLLGVATSALTDRIVALEDLWGDLGSDLCAELLATRSLPEVVERVSSALARRACETFEPSSARLARRAAHLLEAGEARVESVADQLGVSARHLRRAFTESIGLSPKDFARAARLQRAVRMAATSSDWATIAADAGYYDQAHLIADFRELVGTTPGTFVKRAGDQGVGHGSGEAEAELRSSIRERARHGSARGSPSSSRRPPRSAPA